MINRVDSWATRLAWIQFGSSCKSSISSRPLISRWCKLYCYKIPSKEWECVIVPIMNNLWVSSSFLNANCHVLVSIDPFAIHPHLYRRISACRFVDITLCWSVCLLLKRWPNSRVGTHQRSRFIPSRWWQSSFVGVPSETPHGTRRVASVRSLYEITGNVNKTLFQSNVDIILFVQLKCGVKGISRGNCTLYSHFQLG